MNTQEIMQIALGLADMREIPADSGIHVNGQDIRRVMISIDVSVSELLLARNLACDCVIAHHPLGETSINFHKVLSRHKTLMVQNGVPEDVAEDAVSRLVTRIEVRNHAANYSQVVEAARLMKMPLLNIHLPLDEVGRRKMDEVVPKSQDILVKDIINSLSRIPELQRAKTEVKLRLGIADSVAYPYVIVHGAGTNGGYPVAKAYFENGISTIAYIHIDPEELRKLREENIRGNLIVTGHIASDSIGINTLIESLRKSGLEVLPLGIV